MPYHRNKAYNTKEFTFYVLFTKKESNSKLKLCVKMGNEKLFFTKMDLSVPEEENLMTLSFYAFNF